MFEKYCIYLINVALVNKREFFQNIKKQQLTTPNLSDIYIFIFF